MAESDGRELDNIGASDADADAETTVSMVDVLNDEQQLEQDADAVLGACDDCVCTYSQVLACPYQINFFIFY